MSGYEKAAFCVMAALIFPAFAPVDLLSGKIVAGVGFFCFAGAALIFAGQEQSKRRIAKREAEDRTRTLRDLFERSGTMRQ